MMQLSIVVPVYNEEEVLPEFFRRLRAILSSLHISHEVIFVDDGSSDRTFDILSQYAKGHKFLKVVRFSRNFGHQAAVSAGIDHARGEAVVIIDGDLQDPPELVPQMFEKYKEGYEVVYGVREKRKEYWWKRASIFIFYRLARLMVSEVDFPLDSGDFSLISKRVASILRSMPERNRYVRGLRSWVGFRQAALFYRREERKLGRTKYPFWKLMKLAYDGLFSFSYLPLRIITVWGLGVSVLSFATIVVLFYFRIFTDRYIPGWTSLAVAVLFLGGVQLISLGIIGEYISRIYDETKGRPRYIIDKKVGFNDTP